MSVRLEHRIWIGTRADLRAGHDECPKVAYPLFELYLDLKSLIIEGVNSRIHGESGEYIGKDSEIAGDGVNDWSGADRRNPVVAILCPSYESIILVYDLMQKWEDKCFSGRLTSFPDFDLQDFDMTKLVKREHTHIWHVHMTNEWGDTGDFEQHYIY